MPWVLATVYSSSSSSSSSSSISLSLSLSLSLSILVQRISKSSLNPRGPLTKTLGSLTNLGVLASLFLIGENSKIRKWIDFWRFCQIFYIWFWVCSQRHGMVIYSQIWLDLFLHLPMDGWSVAILATKKNSLKETTGLGKSNRGRTETRVFFILK